MEHTYIYGVTKALLFHTKGLKIKSRLDHYAVSLNKTPFGRLSVDFNV